MLAATSCKSAEYKTPVSIRTSRSTGMRRTATHNVGAYVNPVAVADAALPVGQLPFPTSAHDAMTPYCPLRIGAHVEENKHRRKNSSWIERARKRISGRASVIVAIAPSPQGLSRPRSLSQPTAAILHPSPPLPAGVLRPDSSATWCRHPFLAFSKQSHMVLHDTDQKQFWVVQCIFTIISS